MRISELCDITGVPRATVKFYLREGLVPPGEAVSRTQAAYGQGHVDRIRLVRALTEVAGLRLDDVRRVLAAIDGPATSRLEVMAAAQEAMISTVPADRTPAGRTPAGRTSDGRTSDGRTSDDHGPDGRDADPGDSRAEAWLSARGWRVEPGGALIGDLDRALSACEQAGVPVDEARLNGYADAVERIAALDLDSVPEDPHAAVRQVVIGTYLVDPLLACLRRLAQQHTAMTRLAGPDDDWLRLRRAATGNPG